MKVKVVPSTWLGQEGRRLDSSPYLSGAMEAKVALENLAVPKMPLHEVTEGGLAGIFHAGRSGREYVNNADYGVPFLGSIDILAADLSYLPLLSKRQIARSPGFLIQEGWTLITRSGTIGRMAYVRPDMAGMACSEHAMRVKPDTDKIPSGYLFAYLRSSYGVPLVVFGTYGAIVQHIEPHHIANLPVPRLGDTLEAQVHQKVVEAAQLRTQYQHQVRQATQQLFAAVGLTDITPAQWHALGTDLGFTQKITSPESLRALNFNPRFQSLVAELASVNHELLGDICANGELRSGLRFRRIDCEPVYGVKLIGQKELFWLQPEGRWISSAFAPPDIFVEDETILLASQGTLGESEVFCRGELITGEWTKYAYSQHLLRVRSGIPDISGAFLFAFLRSETVFRCLRSMSRGSKLQDFHRDILARLPVPIPSMSEREEIENLIRNAYQVRHQALILEEEAIKDVEDAIHQEAAT